MQSFEEGNDQDVGHALPSGDQKFVYQVLNGPNEHCLENFRMDKSVFYKLCNVLQTRGLLHHTNRIRIEEQLAIFLFIIGHNLRTRAVQELFKYSGETISRHFNNVLNAFSSISPDLFQAPEYDVPQEILEDPTVYPYFKDCVGIVDCISIPVMVGVDEQGPFRNKNGLLTQNVLAACSLDLKFHYVLAGWEGSAPSQQILHAALTRRHKLHVPEGKYYLVSSKYPNVPGFVAPYQDVQINTNEESNENHVKDPKELFNLRHHQLHSAASRVFEALRKRFAILVSAPPYPLHTQVKLVVAACALHNFIFSEGPDDLVSRMSEGQRVSGTEDLSDEEALGHDGLQLGFSEEEIEDSLQLRDEIASFLWDGYIQESV